MSETIGSRFKNAWNAFFNRDPTYQYNDFGTVSYYRPDRPKLSYGNEQSIINSVFNKIAVDVSSNIIKHVRLDENDRYLEDIDSGLNECLNLSANIDQTGRAFIMDAVISMFNEGVVALIPIDTKGNPYLTDSYDILSIRTGKIVEWRPNSIKVNLYNEITGKHEEIIVPKRIACIIENPFYSVMNEPNSTLKRLIRKLNILDMIDEQSGSGKLDLIIQLPYTIKTELRKKQAEERRKDIEMQLSGSKYGIAYTDGTEHITQLNRPAENNLMKQIEYLTGMLYSQLSITKEVLEGTADEKTMLNYNTRTIEPILSCLVGEMKRKWLTQTARSQKQSILYFNDPFKLVPVSQIANIADAFTRNEIMSSNEIRQIVGLKPSKDPSADELRNKNLNRSNSEIVNKEEKTEEGGINQNESRKV